MNKEKYLNQLMKRVEQNRNLMLIESFSLNLMVLLLILFGMFSRSKFTLIVFFMLLILMQGLIIIRITRENKAIKEFFEIYDNEKKKV